MESIEATVVRIHEIGGPEKLVVERMKLPAPGPGEALVKIEAAGVNFIDVYRRSGVYDVPRPFTLGSEGAGIVVATGENTGDPKIGARVAWSDVPGSYATHAIAKVDKLVPVPDGVSSATAAAAMLQGMTADYLVRDTFALGASHTCIIHAAAGGVGLLLCQLAKRAGASIILGTAGSAETAELAKKAGATHVVSYRTEDFEAEARRITNGRGVSVVYDSVGKDTFEKSLRSLARRGMLVSFGQSSGVVPPFSPLLLSKHGSLFLTRPTLFDYVADRGELLARAARVLDAVEKHELDVRIHASLPLSDAAEAHRLLESRATRGKLVLVP